MNKLIRLCFWAMLLLLTACLQIENQYIKIPPGTWRGQLLLDENPVIPNPKAQPLSGKVGMKMEDIMEGELPFNFDVIYTDDTTFHIELKNAEEIITLKDIHFGRDRKTARDTLLIDFPEFESYISAIYKENVMQGFWHVKSKANYSIPFVAKFGKKHRFTILEETPTTDVSGKWEASFGLDTDEPYKAIGSFVQEGNDLTGTFMTETGDYRYLEGTMQGDKLHLSCFDGAHSFLFAAKIVGQDSLTGSFRNGRHYKTTWEAKRNPDAKLTDPNKLTYLLEGYDKLEFSFENTKGQLVSLEDETFKNKVKIVQVFGTWCPNCKDETIFLTDYLKKNPNPNLKVLGLAFERHDKKEKAMNILRLYKERMGIEYDLLHAGRADKKAAVEQLPMLNAIISYPTLIFIDKKDKIRNIHTGFYGPATDQYESFKSDFDNLVQELLNE